MNIECIKCSKIFEVNSDLIPDKGRNLQCGSCNHIWFFNKQDHFKIQKVNIEKKEISPSILNNFETQEFEDQKDEKNDFKTKKIKKELIKKVKPKSSLRISHFLSLIIVLIISFIAAVIFVDTFKNPLFNYFPNLEPVFFNLFETIKDISLFIRDIF
tara:strand:- start:824 stop:1294 length:471 start_codon:yes stop_codon:yes gene_type:complete